MEYTACVGGRWYRVRAKREWFDLTGNQGSFESASNRGERGVATSLQISATPLAIAGLGWVTVGSAMWGAGDREWALLAGGRRRIEHRNSDLARRL
jgi:hypothetical protein